MLYFAYGSNMDAAAMRCRCPAARAQGTAVLDGYRFFIGLEGWGSIRPARGHRVHGILWRVTPRDIAALHAYELLHQGVYKVRHVPVLFGAQHVRAMTYRLRRDVFGKPKPDYIESCAAAARAWKLPEHYRRSIERRCLTAIASS